MPAGRRCPGPGCPTILTNGERYCATHQRDYEHRRGTTTTRGYGPTHTRTRAALTAQAAAGLVIRCVTCGRRLAADDIDLGHNANRTRYLGPQCQPCNRGDGGRHGATISNVTRQQDTRDDD